MQIWKNLSARCKFSDKPSLFRKIGFTLVPADSTVLCPCYHLLGVEEKPKT